MRLEFRYRLQAEAKGNTPLGRNVQFIVEEEFPAVIETATHLEDAEQISFDIDGDFTGDPVRVLLQAKVEEYCKRYNVIPHSVELANYRVTADHPDVMLSFSNQTFSKKTDEDEAYIYAYRLTDEERPLMPTNVQVQERDGALSIGWVAAGHIHGTRIYNAAGELLASLGADTYEWTDSSATESGRLYSYHLRTYHANAESEAVVVSVRLSGGMPAEEESSPEQESRRRSVSNETLLPAFQSGIGDREDLSLSLTPDAERGELFTYELQIKGYKKRTIHVYPRSLFRYRITVLDANGNAKGPNPWRIGILDGDGDLNIDGGGKRDVRLRLHAEVPHLTESDDYLIEVEEGEVEIEYFTETQEGDEPYIVFRTQESALQEKEIEEVCYGEPSVTKTPILIQVGERKRFEGEVWSPAYDPTLFDREVDRWEMIVRSNNPNVSIRLVNENPNLLSDRQYLEFLLEAEVINPTQTSWHPEIRSGHYYLNQAEHYLYAESDIKKKVLGLAGIYVQPFDYEIFAISSNEDYKDREYTVRLRGEVPSDGEYHLVSESPISVLVREYLDRVGNFDQSTDEMSTFVMTGEGNGIEVTVGGKIEAEQGYLEHIYARTTEVIYQESPDSDVFDLDANNSLLLTPAPVLGSPIVAVDATGLPLQQVFFTDDEGALTLDHTEHLTSNDFNELHLSYLNVDFDTLRVARYTVPAADAGGRQQKGEWTEVEHFTVHGGVVHLYPDQQPGEEYEVRYRLQRSFIAEAAPEDSIRLTFHGAVPDEEKGLSVRYETKADELRSVSSIDTNPLLRRQHTGFIYLDDKRPEPTKLTIEFAPAVMYTKRNEQTFFRIHLTDADGNPVADEQVEVTARTGAIELLDEQTNEDGFVRGVYTAPDEPGEAEIFAYATNAVANARHVFQVKDAATPKRIHLETSFPTIYPQLNTVEVAAYLYGEDQTPLEGVAVKFTIPHSIQDAEEVETDAFGCARVRFEATEIPRTGFIPVTAEAKEVGLREQTVVRILGFRDYDEHHFVDANNLIDHYDRLHARAALGMTAGNHPPEDGEALDIWLDQSDILYLMQSYELRDVEDPKAARGNLGVNVTSQEPKDQWPNDLWFFVEEE